MGPRRRRAPGAERHNDWSDVQPPHPQQRIVFTLLAAVRTAERVACKFVLRMAPLVMVLLLVLSALRARGARGVCAVTRSGALLRSPARTNEYISWDVTHARELACASAHTGDVCARACVCVCGACAFERT